MQSEIIIIGAGFTGSTLANLFATKANKKVLLLDRRSHIGGNCYDYVDAYGVIVQKYGPHIFHTKYVEVWDYLNQFTAFNSYVHLIHTWVNGEWYEWPITLRTINKFFKTNLNREQAELFLNNLSLDTGVDNFENAITKQIGKELYESFIKNYSRKQWGVDPDKLASRLAFRIPIRLDNDARLFAEPYQGLPTNGFTPMFEKMLSHPNITIKLNTEFQKIRSGLKYDHLIITSPIDEYFDYCYGPLGYRGQQFIFESMPGDYQKVAVCNYPNDHDYVRITEMKKFYLQDLSRTTICKEFPIAADGDNRTYPIPDSTNDQLFTRYMELTKQEEHVHFAGRLGKYKYLNMDQCVKEGMDLFEALE